MNKISDREKFLMIQWGKCHEYYETVDQWLSDVIDDQGHTVEDAVSYDADQYQLNLTEEV
jgi:hypothetical protein